MPCKTFSNLSFGVVWFLMFIGGVYIDLWLSPLKAIMCAVVVKLIDTKKPIVILVASGFREPPWKGGEGPRGDRDEPEGERIKDNKVSLSGER